MVNEVSIVDEQNRNQSLITGQTNSNDNVNQFIQQTIKSPVSNTGQVTSIRNVSTPNTRSSSNQKSTTPNKVVNNIVLTPKNAAHLKKITSTNKGLQLGKQQQQSPANTINLSPTQSIQLSSNNQQQILTKVIMTTGGQQLLITSPVKGQTQLTGLTNNQDKQLIGLLPVTSPSKSPAQKANSSPNVSLRSKPSTAANLTVQSLTNQQPQALDKQPQYQIIRLVSATNNTSSTTSSPITTANLKQITTANLTTGVAGSQKVLIPASAIKGLNQAAGNAATQQFLMYAAPTQLIQQSPTAQVTTPKKVTFSTPAGSSANSGSSNNQRQAYVPILPNPSTVLNNSTSAAASRASTSKSLQNGAKANLTNTSQEDAQQHNQSANVANLSAVATAPASGSSNRPRKPCNCTRSQCLKLYCDCFANGEFCSNCNCINCFNNLDHEENRQKAIKQCLERNPHAFHPKIGKGKTTAQEGIGIERRHTKGCNCRRSGCLKNYCECYEAKILCTDLCKCCACKNYEDSYERKSLMHLVDAVDIRSSLHGTTGSNFGGKENDPLWSNEFRPKLPVPLISDRLISCSFITNDLVDATTKCLIAQAEKSQKLGLSNEEIEKSIIEEFGSCLTQIIDAANKEKQKDK